MAEQHHVVIIGGGFGGLYAARALRRAPVRITLIDRKNHHLFQPLLYQVATAGLNPADIATPIRRVLRRQRNVEVLLADAESIDVKSRQIKIKDDGVIDYDTLILATGATHSYFGHPEWERVAPGLKTLEDALEIRKRLFFAFEAAEREAHPEHRKAWMTFVVVGGGPTGVELAGAIIEIAVQTLKRDFRRIDPASARVILIEGSPSILGAYVPELRDKALQQLARLGVEVRTGTIVTGIDEQGVRIGDERIEARTVLWAAGVAASPLMKSLGVPLDRAGRAQVEPDLSIPGHPEVFVVGDAAAFKYGDGMVPGVAPAAMQEAKHAADNIVRTLENQPRRPFHYHDKGSLATIGRAAAIADLGKVKLWGFLAWLAWLFIHIFFLIGFRNRVAAMFSWAITYMTYERGARLITGRMPVVPPFHALPTTTDEAKGLPAPSTPSPLSSPSSSSSPAEAPPPSRV